MSHAATTRRGQPLVFLFVLLGGWMTLRLAMWENPWPQEIMRTIGQPVQDRPGALYDRAIAEARKPSAPIDAPPVAMPVSLTAPPPAILPASGDRPSVFAPGRSMTGHNLVWMAAMSRLPMPTSVADALDRNSGVERAAVPLPQSVRDHRKPWRFDGWVLLRGAGRTALSGGEQPASYGGSQLGGVLAYRLDPASGHDPALYLRASAALREPHETEAAFGLRARPVADLPVTFHAEARLSERRERAEVRPAVFATVGFERKGLPLGIGMRGYAQAGYVAGRDASAFVDGLAVAEREVARFDLAAVNAEVRAGAGIWGGAQKGASRLDVGPSTSMDLRMGEVSARVSLDYRIRVAGDAEPENGPAFTLSTGF